MVFTIPVVFQTDPLELIELLHQLRANLVDLPFHKATFPENQPRIPINLHEGSRDLGRAQPAGFGHPPIVRGPLTQRPVDEDEITHLLRYLL